MPIFLRLSVWFCVVVFLSFPKVSIAVSSSSELAEYRRAQFVEFEKLFQMDMPDSERLEKASDQYYEYFIAAYPDWAQYLGETRFQDQWTDNSPANYNEQKKENKRALELLESIDASELSKDDRIDLQIFTFLVNWFVESDNYHDVYMPVTQLTGVHIDTISTLNAMPANNPDDFKAIVGRLRGVSTMFENAILWMQEGSKRGITPPAVTLRDIPQALENLLDAGENSPWLSTFATKPQSIPEGQFEQYRKEAQLLVKKDITPAVEKLKVFMERDYIPNARVSISWSSLPDGEAWYRMRLRNMTTTDMSPSEIHELGLSEVKRISSQMKSLVEESGFAGSYEEFTDYLRTDQKFYFNAPEQLLVGYRNLAKRADAELPKLFGHLPRLTYGIKPVPGYAEKSAPAAYYRDGSLKTGVPGIFFANTYDLSSRPKWEMEALTLHEAVPGHHFQIAIQGEQENVRWYRRLPMFGSYIEGWGLYAESLGADMGFYDTPYSQFSQLTFEIWRAIRLVVDTGIHMLGWSREEAIDYFKQYTAKSEREIAVEVDRYIVMAGQATVYKIGELKIKELRHKAKTQLGDAFDIREFHDVVLTSGALPLNVLEKKVASWIASKS